MENMEKFQKAMASIKGNFLHLLSDRDSLLELVEMFHGASLKDEEEIYKLTQELMTTQDSLKSTKFALQESKMVIEKLHEKLQRSHLL